MSNPNKTQLDQQQILQAAFDGSSDKLRVDASIAVGAVEAEINVELSAADGDSVNAVQSGTWNINNVSGTVSLPTGAATSANQTTANTTLTSIETKVTRGFSTGVNTRPTCTTTSSIILAANANRKYASIFNQSGVILYIKLGNTAVTNQGIRLPNNTLFEINANNLWLGDIHAVVGSGSQQIEVFEGT